MYAKIMKRIDCNFLRNFMKIEINPTSDSITFRLHPQLYRIKVKYVSIPLHRVLTKNRVKTL